jgi:hypothetical protein
MILLKTPYNVEDDNVFNAKSPPANLRNSQSDVPKLVGASNEARLEDVAGSAGRGTKVSAMADAGQATADDTFSEDVTPVNPTASQATPEDIDRSKAIAHKLDTSSGHDRSQESQLERLGFKRQRTLGKAELEDTEPKTMKRCRTRGQGAPADE